MSKEGVVFLPVRNFNLLPEENIGRDIDMAILRSDTKKWERMIAGVASQLGLEVFWGRNYKYCRQIHLIDEDGSELEIDLLPRFFWRGIEWLDEKDVISSSVVHRGFVMKPLEKHEFLITFNHSYLHGGFYPDKYHNRLIQIYNQDPRAIVELMEYVYGKKDSQVIVRMMLDHDQRGLNKINRQVRIRCLIRALFRDGVGVLSGFLSSYAYDYYLKLSHKT
ncbi:MAG: hypothetical protein P8I13_03430 [Porticoccaceae bacterium]|nr:hypothetical protein [Porticoccaceae bacterium]